MTCLQDIRTTLVDLSAYLGNEYLFAQLPVHLEHILKCMQSLPSHLNCNMVVPC